METKKKILIYAEISVDGIGLFAVMVHFFGIIRFVTVRIGCWIAVSNR